MIDSCLDNFFVMLTRYVQSNFEVDKVITNIQSSNGDGKQGNLPKGVE